MSTRTERAKQAILRALDEIGGAAGAARITRRLAAMGVDLQPRTVRFYLLRMDRDGLTQYVGRREGRVITERGREEMACANVFQKLGFVAAKVDALGYAMSFNLDTGQGTVVANTGFIKQRDLPRAILRMRPVFERHFGMGTRAALARQGERLGSVTVGRGTVALGTLCSVTVNGVLLEAGIPVQSRFGGLVEIADGRPVRFVDLIEYTGTTVDPLEIFITAGRTQVLRCAETGSGIIGASLREVPSAALDDVVRIRGRMQACGLGGILMIGRPNAALLDVPVPEGRTGIVVVGGLNPLAALHEAGIPLTIQPLAGLEHIDAFVPFEDLALKGRRLTPYVD
ncbi:MAG: DUF128 domain-containing protein [Kiritimatiellae bacterium]|nr:DUF128 domain-containing protein [Kiritimatiellia bacterium]